MRDLFKIIICTIVIIFSIPTISSAEETINITINGQPLYLENQPIKKDGSILVYAEEMFISLDLQYKWDEQEKILYGILGKTVIQLPLNDNKVTVLNKEEELKTYSLDVPVQYVNNAIYVPLRTLAEAAECEVHWDNNTKTVVINKDMTKSIQKVKRSDGVYEGEIARNKLNGYGKYEFNTGEIFVGNWFNDLPNGQGTYTLVNGEEFSGEWTNGNLIKGTHIYNDGTIEYIDKDADNYKQQAIDGPTYSELIANNDSYINTPDYFEGEVLEIMSTQEQKIILVDTASFINAFVDFQMACNDIPLQSDSSDRKILAIYCNKEDDIIIGDYIKVYGNIAPFFSFKDNYNNIYTVPSMYLTEYDRGMRSNEILDEIINGDHRNIDDIMRSK